MKTVRTLRRAVGSSESAQLFLLVTIVAAAGGFMLRFGWLPNDVGGLGQSAQRVRLGEVPHVDFEEPYTGLLSYIHAGATYLFGSTVASLRLFFLAVAVGWALVLARLGRRIMSLFAAVALAGVLFVGTVALHLSPMPSWYNVFLATGSALFCRSISGGRKGGELGPGRPTHGPLRSRQGVWSLRAIPSCSRRGLAAVRR